MGEDVNRIYRDIHRQLVKALQPDTDEMDRLVQIMAADHVMRKCAQAAAASERQRRASDRS